MVDISGSACWATLRTAVFVLALSGCTPEEPGHQLRVDLITDFVPGTEFDAVRVSIGEGDIRERFDHIADPSRDYVRGVALGNVGAATGEHAIEVSLFRDGRLLIARPVSVLVQEAITVATVVITRDCRGVMCPGSGDSPLLASCLGGQCADPRCTVETPEYCPPGTCFTAAECDPHVCAQATCVTGACLQDVEEHSCGPAQRCDVELGCVESDSDAGSPFPDAGVSDVGMPDVQPPELDAGPDARDAPDVFDAGPPPGCAGPDADTIFLFNFMGLVDVVSGIEGGATEGGGVTAGDSPCMGQVFSSPGPGVSRLVIPNEPSFLLDEGSLDFWVRRPVSSGAPVGVVSRDEMSISTPGQLTLFLSQDDRLVLRGQQSDTVHVLLCSGEPVPIEEWVRIGISWGPAGLELYMNGVRQMGSGTARIFDRADDPCSESTIPFSIAGTDDPFVLGASAHLSEPGSDEPTAFPAQGWAFDHFRLSRVRRDYTTEL